uniref:non-specific serine/threonine protein kinase n=1 Tax=Parastrongyloides trichosuri TaxID=131310 RepID=A0A0N4Z4M5_PARTI
MLKRFIGIGLMKKKKDKDKKSPKKVLDGGGDDTSNPNESSDRVDNKHGTDNSPVNQHDHVSHISRIVHPNTTKTTNNLTTEVKATSLYQPSKVTTAKHKPTSRASKRKSKELKSIETNKKSKNITLQKSHKSQRSHLLSANVKPVKNSGSKRDNKKIDVKKDDIKKEEIKKEEKKDDVKKDEIKDTKKEESKNVEAFSKKDINVEDSKNVKSKVNLPGAQALKRGHGAGIESRAPTTSKLDKEGKPPKEPKPLAEGTMIAFNWEIKKTLGKGSFGQVYLAEHTQTHVKIAIKTLLASYQEFRIAMERDVLKLCSEKLYFPKVYLSGMHDIYYCIGMSLLGPSLTDIRKATKTSKVEPQYCMIVCKQMVIALRTLHELGYVHRDIKPSNICTGYPGTPEAKNMCYLIDFGIVRKFIISGVIVQPKGKGRLRGTMRYLSLNCHQLLELGPADDLHSLYYSIAELGTGSLPWRSCSDIKEVEKMKREYDFSKHRGDLPEHFQEFWNVIKDVTNIQLPDYTKCLDVIEKCIPEEYRGNNFVFPWHDAPIPSQ